MRHIRLFLRGGLGNQLFQVAGGLELRRAYGARLVLDDTIYRVGLGPRTTADVREVEVEPLARALGATFGHLPLANRVNAWRPLINRVARNRSHRDLRVGVVSTADFIGVDHVDRAAAELVEGFSSLGYFVQEPTVAQGVHLRLGDYRRLAHLYGHPDPAYYRTAMREGFSPDEPVCVFSDEEADAVDWFAQHVPGYTFVGAGELAAADDGRASDASPSWAALQQMVACERLVVGNSTFSWWAGWIGGHLFQRWVAAPAVMRPTELLAPEGAVPVSWSSP